MAVETKKHKAAHGAKKKGNVKSPVPLDLVRNKILLIRDRRVLLDSDLAALYGTTTKRLNEQVRRNSDRFPEDFMFRLSKEEFETLRSHLATSNGGSKRGGRRYPPNVFTEYGAIMAANVLNTSRATETSIFVVRAFVSLRDYMASNTRLARKLDELEQQVGTHDAAISALVNEIQKLLNPKAGKKRPVGFIIGRNSPGSDRGKNDARSDYG